MTTDDLDALVDQVLADADLPPQDPTGEVAVGRTLVTELGRLAAEPAVLATWRKDSALPRLADAYSAMVERVSRRINDVTRAAHDEAAVPEEALGRATLDAHSEAQAVTFELSRLKWLLSNRRSRLGRTRIPGYAPHVADEVEEIELIEALMEDLARRVC